MWLIITIIAVQFIVQIQYKIVGTHKIKYMHCVTYCFKIKLLKNERYNVLFETLKIHGASQTPRPQSLERKKRREETNYE